MNHPNLRFINAFRDRESIQAYLRNHTHRNVFFRPCQICQYRCYQVGGDWKLEPYYAISSLDKHKEKYYALYKIVDIRPDAFDFNTPLKEVSYG